MVRTMIVAALVVGSGGCATSKTLTVGSRAPAFPPATRLADGEGVTLASLHRDGPAVLVFLRGFS